MSATLLVGTAGTGKTTELQRRAVELLRGNESVTLIARNRPAARALRLQITKEVGATDGLTVATVHSLALGLIKRGWRLLGYEREPALVSAPEQVARVQSMLREPSEQARWERFPRARTMVGFAADLRSFIARALDADESPERLSERASFAAQSSREAQAHLVEAAAFYGRYLEASRLDCEIDHGTAIRQAATLLELDSDSPTATEAHLAFIAAARSEAGHVLVDDLQVLTPAMLRFVSALAGASMTAALDPEGPSFAFRGGTELIEDGFSQRFHPLDRLELAQTFRPTPAVSSHRFAHPADQRASMVHEIRRAHGDLKLAYSDIAILVQRIGPEVQAIRRTLERALIPVTVVGENRALHAEAALAPMIDLLDCACDVTTRAEVLPRILTSPMYGLDSFGLRELNRAARRKGTDLAGLLADPSDLHESYQQALMSLHVFLDELAGKQAEWSADRAWWWLWTGAPDSQGRPRFRHFIDLVEAGPESALDAVDAFATHIGRAAERRASVTLFEVIETMRAATFGAEPWGAPDERRPNSVRIMTPFGALGREFELVIVPDCVDGSFPSQRPHTPLFDITDLMARRSDIDRQRRHAEHESRVFRSMIDRARQRVLLLCAEDANGIALPSPIALERGWMFTDPVPSPPSTVFSRDDLEAIQRKRLADVHSSAELKKEALGVLARLRGVEPEDWWYEQEWTRTDGMIRSEPFRTSYSKLESYENCPLSYLYGSEAGLDQGGSPATAVGTWVHNVFERASRQIMEGEPPASKEQMLAWLEEQWDPTVFDNAAVEHRRRLESEKMISRWLMHDVHEPVQAVEQGFVFEEGIATVRGFIDRIAGRKHGNGSEIIDYKTGASLPSQDEVENSLQLAIYHLAVERDPAMAGFAPVKAAALRFMGKGQERRPYASRRFVPDDDYGVRAAERLKTIVGSISEGKFSPSGEADCKWCRFKTICPIQPVGTEVVL